MPLLIAEGRILLSVAGLMKRRLEVLDAYNAAVAAKKPKEEVTFLESVTNAWWDNYFESGDGNVRHRDGRLKIVPDAKYLRELTPETKLFGGSVNLSDSAYEKLAGEEFSKAEVEKYFHKMLNKAEAKAHPVWLALARGDKKLLGMYVDAVFYRAKQRFNYHYDKAMDIYDVPTPVPEQGAVGRLWVVSELPTRGLGGWRRGNLRRGRARLVGVAPEK